jgi:hypothetical protein
MTGRQGYASGMTVNPIQLQKFLGGIDYPARKQDLIKTAQKAGADQNVMNTLKSLPRDDFNSPNDISEAIGDMHHHR